MKVLRILLPRKVLQITGMMLELSFRLLWMRRLRGARFVLLGSWCLQQIHRLLSGKLIVSQDVQYTVLGVATACVAEVFATHTANMRMPIETPPCPFSLGTIVT